MTYVTGDTDFGTVSFENEDEVEAFNEPKFFVVSVYLADRAYGGPEEGGWYYDCGYPATEYGQFTRVFGKKAEQAALAYKRRLDRHLIKHLNKGRRPKWSVASDGVYEAVLDRGEFPGPYPTERPYYE